MSSRQRSVRASLLLALCMASSGCASRPLVVHGQKVPEHHLAASPADFRPADGAVVLHYYGSGGWGIQWKSTYLLTAPYFSNHGFASIGLLELRPDAGAIRDGVAGTPFASTAAILVGHGHIDHAGDIPGFFGAGLIQTRPALVADATVFNLLAQLMPSFGCGERLDHDSAGKTLDKCRIPGVRITPLHSAHAPHAKIKNDLLEGTFSMFDGSLDAPLNALPREGKDFQLGRPWAYLIDLLEQDDGKPVFRIHYMDAAASPPHGFVPPSLLAERDVDVHIACVPSYDLVDSYPRALLRSHHVRYVLAAHWEDFFLRRDRPLRPVEPALDASKLDTFVDLVEAELTTRPRGVAPVNKDSCTPQTCGPRGATWALPVPGETYRFQASAAQPPLQSVQESGATGDLPSRSPLPAGMRERRMDEMADASPCSLCSLLSPLDVSARHEGLRSGPARAR